MAVVLVQECPHCGAENTAFDLRGEWQDREHGAWNMFFTCNTCQRPVCAFGFPARSGATPEGESGRVEKSFGGLLVWPRAPVPSAPAHCPQAVAAAFLQADTTIRRKGFSEPTAAMDRRALELATKAFAPDLAGETLHRRIEQLAQRHLLTPALREWAHELRTLGNDALHEEAGVTPEEARQTHELTRYVLTYLFTLPEQVRASREARAN